MEAILGTFPTIGAIAVICFLVGQALKTTPIATKYIPVIVALLGGVLGVLGFMTGVSELQNMDIFEAIATGICSGLVSSGAYSLTKNVSGAYPENSLSKSEQNALAAAAAATVAATVEAETTETKTEE